MFSTVIAPTRSTARAGKRAEKCWAEYKFPCPTVLNAHHASKGEKRKKTHEVMAPHFQLKSILLDLGWQSPDLCLYIGLGF